MHSLPSYSADDVKVVYTKTNLSTVELALGPNFTPATPNVDIKLSYSVERKYNILC